MRNTILGNKDSSHSSANHYGLDISIDEISGKVDTEQNKKDIDNEMSKRPYPDAILLVLKKGQYTEEDSKSVQHFVDICGEKIRQYFIVISTTKYILNEHLLTLIGKCEGRVMVFFDNSKKDIPVKELLEMIIKNVGKINGNANSMKYAEKEKPEYANSANETRQKTSSNEKNINR